MSTTAGVYTLRIVDGTIDSRTATTTLVELSGTPINTDTWTIVIDGLHRFSVTVNSSGSTATVPGIAAALAAKIKAGVDDDGHLVPGFSATAEGAVVVIVNAAGSGFQATFDFRTRAEVPVADVTQIKGATAVAVLSGTLVAGDEWIFTVSGKPYSFVIGSTDTLAGLFRGQEMLMLNTALPHVDE